MSRPQGEAARPEPGAAPGAVWGDLRRKLLVGTVMALAGAALYGANIPAARAASQAGMPGAELILYRSLFLLPILAAAAFGLGETLRPAAGESGPLLRLAVAAGMTATFYLSALDHLTVPLAVVLFYTFPLIVMILSNRIEGRRLAGRQVAVFATAFIGLMIAVGPSFDHLVPRGVIYALVAAMASAGLFILAGRTSGPALRTAFWVQAGVIPIALAFVLVSGGPAPLAVFAKAPLAIALAMGAYAIAFIFQLAAAQRISASRASLLFLFEPVTAIILAGFFLGEVLAPLQIAGVALIVAALAAEILLDTPRPAPAVALHRHDRSV